MSSPAHKRRPPIKPRQKKQNAAALDTGADLTVTDAYALLLGELKRRIASAQIRAHMAVCRELILLYWQTGRDIVLRQKREGWGKSVIERLAKDLQDSFPGIEGFSANNIWRMRAFYLAYVEVDTILAQAAQELNGEIPHGSPKPILAQPVQELAEPSAILLGIPWGHNITLIQKIKDPALRLWYAAQASEHGWSRSVLTLQIQSKLHERQGKAVTNFKQTLPEPQSDLAQQLVKDPYNFGFLTLGADARERDLELGLIEHLSKFLVELGTGFAFVGRQVHVEIGDDDFYIDLLFYHLRLRCFVVIELKRGAFKPEYASKTNFYLNVVDDKMRHPDDQPSIGLILCQEKKRLIAEYALRGMNKAIGVSEYQLTRNLPKKLKGSLPTIAEIEKELGPA
jgi:predicted nuclease of restriction endonuclease-like (RecB) superfamily